MSQPTPHEDAPDAAPTDPGQADDAVAAPAAADHPPDEPSLAPEATPDADADPSDSQRPTRPIQIVLGLEGTD